MSERVLRGEHPGASGWEHDEWRYRRAGEHERSRRIGLRIGPARSGRGLEVKAAPFVSRWSMVSFVRRVAVGVGTAMARLPGVAVFVRRVGHLDRCDRGLYRRIGRGTRRAEQSEEREGEP